MIIDGRKIAEDAKARLRKEISQISEKPKLAVLLAREHPASRSFVRIKEKFGESIGVSTETFEFPDGAKEDEIINKIQELNQDPSITGIVMQLPLPPHFRSDEILNSVEKTKDIDVLGRSAYESFEEGLSQNRSDFFLPPVVGAVSKIFGNENVSLEGVRALVVGKGRLVGKPVSAWLQAKGAEVSVVEEGVSLSEYTKDADIIISGAGASGIITPEMIRLGCVLVDAGTSEVSGELRGDALAECAEKCRVFTPVPGGVGPLTVACLFENLWKAYQVQTKERNIW